MREYICVENYFVRLFINDVSARNSYISWLKVKVDSEIDIAILLYG